MNLLNIVPLIASIAYKSGAIFTLELFSLVASIPNNCTNLQSTDHCQSDHCDCQFLNASIDFFSISNGFFFSQEKLFMYDCSYCRHWLCACQPLTASIYFCSFSNGFFFSQEKIIKLCDCLLLTASRAPSKSVVTGSRCLLRSATKVFFNDLKRLKSLSWQGWDIFHVLHRQRFRLTIWK